MKAIVVISFLIIAGTITSYSQGKLVGGPCEGCEAVFEYGNRSLSSVDTLPEFESEGIQIKVSGTIYQNDGVTPAEGVIMYVYQTDEEGVYPKKGDEQGWAKRHGYIRGWVQTDSEGKYTFYTQKPMFYGSAPAHIHATILEPDGKYYYIKDFLFEGDKNLTSRQINDPRPRGGDKGILSYKKQDGILSAQRDLILGKNVPGYK